MTKEDLIQILAKKTGWSKRTANECLNLILDEITKALCLGKSIHFPGFGKFLVIERKERTGINPKSKQRIKLPARKVPRFKAGQILKDAVK